MRTIIFALCFVLSGCTGAPEILQRVNDRVNEQPYVAEEKQHWGTVEEFMAKGGDCEDFATFKQWLLQGLGVPPASMRLAIVKRKSDGQGHALLLVRDGDREWVLDNLTHWIVTVPEAQADYTFTHWIDARGLHPWAD